MKRLVRIFPAIVFAFLVVLESSSAAFASTFHGIETTGTCPIPADFQFTSSTVCSEHLYFEQVSARDDGWFAVYYRYSEDTGFRTAYIDIFDADGTFVRELSFQTKQDFAMELTDEGLLLYFYSFVISYDWDTEQLSGYTIPESSAIDNGVFSDLKQSKFESGGWTYRCRRKLYGYTQLTRENAAGKQELLSLPGNGMNVWNLFILPVILGFVALFIKKRCR